MVFITMWLILSLDTRTGKMILKSGLFRINVVMTMAAACFPLVIKKVLEISHW